MECWVKKLTLFEDVIWLQDNLKIISQRILLEKIDLNLKAKIKIWKEVCQTQGWSGRNLN